MANRPCETCRWWERSTVRPPHRSEYGDCHLYPPDAEFGLPRTSEKGFCSMHENELMELPPDSKPEKGD